MLRKLGVEKSTAKTQEISTFQGISNNLGKNWIIHFSLLVFQHISTFHNIHFQVCWALIAMATGWELLHTEVQTWRVRSSTSSSLPGPSLSLLCHRDPGRDCERLGNLQKSGLLLSAMLWEVSPSDNLRSWLHHRLHHHHWVGVVVRGFRGLEMAKELFVGEAQVSSRTKG